MGSDSKIGWTDHTFNPWVGCMKVSAGCKHCYAERQMVRKPTWANTWGPPELTRRLRTSDYNWTLPKLWNKRDFVHCTKCGWRDQFKNSMHAGLIDICPECEEDALDGTKQRVFCGSLCDVFEDNRKVANWRGDLFRVIERTQNLQWLLLTKRPENIFSLGTDAAGYIFDNWLMDYENVMIGTSAEDQRTVDERIPALVQNMARGYFLSLEPLLEQVDISQHLKRTIRPDWVIVGGESGPGNRPFNWDWARDIRDQCRDAGVAFFMKQGSAPSQKGMPPIPADLQIRQFVGKNNA